MFENALGISDNKLLNQSIEVYPNPNNGSFYLKHNGNSKVTEIVITDILGKKTQTIDLKQLKTQQNIEIPNPVSGIYFLNINTEKASITKKIIIQ